VDGGWVAMRTEGEAAPRCGVDAAAMARAEPGAQLGLVRGQIERCRVARLNRARGDGAGACAGSGGRGVERFEADEIERVGSRRAGCAQHGVVLAPGERGGTVGNVEVARKAPRTN